MAKKCKNCGTPMKEEATVCPKCGKDPDVLTFQGEQMQQSLASSKKKSIAGRIIAVAAVIALCVTLFFVFRGTPGVKYYTVTALKNAQEGSELEALRKEMGFNFDRDSKDQAVCVITDKASGNIKIKNKYKGKFVDYLYAQDNACENIRSINTEKAYLEEIKNVCNFDSENDQLQKVTLGNTVDINNSFNNCSSLESVVFECHPKDVYQSFNNNASLKEVDFGEDAKRVFDLKYSFTDCDSLPYYIIGDDNNWGDVHAKLYTALEKLSDQGVLEKDEDGDPLIEFDDDYNIIFHDKTVGEKLLKDPGTFKNAFYPEEKEDVNKVSKNDLSFYHCDYYVIWNDYDSRVVKDYYTSGDSKFDRIDRTTVVFVIDAETDELVHVHTAGTDIPSHTVFVSSVQEGNQGGALPDEAEAYIKRITE